MEPHTLHLADDATALTAKATGDGQDNALRLFPAARPSYEVVGVFERFGKDMQSFEVVSHYGQLSVRPQSPEGRDATRRRQLPIEEELTLKLKAA